MYQTAMLKEGADINSMIDRLPEVDRSRVEGIVIGMNLARGAQIGHMPSSGNATAAAPEVRPVRPRGGLDPGQIRM